MNKQIYYTIEKLIDYLDNKNPNSTLDALATELKLSLQEVDEIFQEWGNISTIQFLDLYKNLNTKESTSQTETNDHTRNNNLYNLETITQKEYLSSYKDLVIYYNYYETAFGTCLIAVTSKGLCALYFANEIHFEESLEELKKRWINSTFEKSSIETIKYFEKIFLNKHNKEKINLFLKGTNFQIKVWSELLSLSKTQITTYSNIASKINSPKALRAVGTGVGMNPISFLIPCHRVINKNGIIGKYRWGTSRKKAMLIWEKTQKAMLK